MKFFECIIVLFFYSQYMTPLKLQPTLQGKQFQFPLTSLGSCINLWDDITPFK